jgi:hypothetical protein
LVNQAMRRILMAVPLFPSSPASYSSNCPHSFLHT